MTWTLIDNPAWTDRNVPRALKPACHDGSPFLTVECSCGNQMHLHESYTARVSRHLGIASQCKSCGEMLTFPPGLFHQAFKQMRELGWYT